VISSATVDYICNKLTLRLMKYEFVVRKAFGTNSSALICGDCVSSPIKNVTLRLWVSILTDFFSKALCCKSGYRPQCESLCIRFSFEEISFRLLSQGPLPPPSFPTLSPHLPEARLLPPSLVVVETKGL